MPDAIAQDPATRAKVAAGLAKVGARVLHKPREGHGASFFVQATDAQLDSLAALLADVYQHPVAETRAWFAYADRVDVLEELTLIVDTATMRPSELPVPRAWALAAGSRQAVYWIVHFAAPQVQGDEFVRLRKETGPLAKPKPILIHSYTATQAVVRMSAAQARRVRKLPGVDWVGRYEAVLKLGHGLGPSTSCQVGPAGAKRLLRFARVRPKEQVVLSVGLFEASPALIKAITAKGGSASEVDEKLLIVKGPRRLIRWLARRVEVQHIEVAAKKKLPRIGL